LKEVVGLLLAAGAGTRFGSDKLRHALPHGVSIAVQAARHLKSEIETVFAVVRPASPELQKALEAEGCVVVVCDNAADGMGASLACAARAAGERAGYLVALGDMPFIRRSSIAAVRDALAAGAPLTAPYFRSKRGHPVGVSGRFFQDLLSCKGDEGAKALLKSNEALLVKIPIGDPGVLRDIDRPEDLAPPLAV
jgi:molybdenum cofactor cytidylyltransferase